MNDDVVHRTVVRTCGCGFNRFHHTLGFLIKDNPKDGVVSLQPRSGCGGDEKLRPIGALAAAFASIGHGEEERFVEAQLRMNFIVKLVTRTTGSRAKRVSTLNHEPRNDAVENHVGVQGLRDRLTGGRMGPADVASGQADEVLHGFRGMVFEEAEPNVAVVSVQGREVSMQCHSPSLPGQWLCALGVTKKPPKVFCQNEGNSTGGSGPMELSRKRERELGRLSDDAAELWQKQRDLLSRATEVLREAGRQASDIGRGELYPHAKSSVQHAVKPALEKLRKHKPQSEPAPKMGAGAFALMAIGAATVAVVGYAIWSTLRADEDLWVESDDA